MKIGIYNPNLNTMGGGEKVCLALAETLRDSGWKVSLVTEKKIDRKRLEAYFGVSLEGVEVNIVRPHRVVRRIDRSRLPHAARKLLLNLNLYHQIKKLKLDVFVNNAFNTELPSPSKVGVYMCMFPHKLPDINDMNLITRGYYEIMHWLNRILFPGSRYWMDTYQIITANSVFTQGYIKKYWGRDSEILYPISDDATVPGIQKQKIILNVGRFFHNDGIQHHKRQDFLLDAFQRMRSLIDDGWELHFAGTVNQTPSDMAYVFDLLRRSDGYPVYFHLDAPLDKLRQLYSQATLYWHATGYGSDPARSPERQEHFGISTVEAMSTGAIPVVINTAGQREIVIDSENGYLWKTEKDLVDKTLLAINPGERLISERAKASSKSFDKDAFRRNVAAIFSPLLAG